MDLLGRLRKSGIYKVKRLAWGLDGYSELDLIEFRETLLSRAPLVGNFNTTEFISLKKIMRMKLGDQSATANIIAAVLGGDIKPVGRMGNAVEYIVFKKVEINDFIKKPHESSVFILNSGIIEAII